MTCHLEKIYLITQYFLIFQRHHLCRPPITSMSLTPILFEPSTKIIVILFKRNKINLFIKLAKDFRWQNRWQKWWRVKTNNKLIILPNPGVMILNMALCARVSHPALWQWRNHLSLPMPFHAAPSSIFFHSCTPCNRTIDPFSVRCLISHGYGPHFSFPATVPLFIHLEIILYHSSVALCSFGRRVDLKSVPSCFGRSTRLYFEFRGLESVGDFVA
jgi:hypothetical protein